MPTTPGELVMGWSGTYTINGVERQMPRWAALSTLALAVLLLPGLWLLGVGTAVWLIAGWVR